MAAFHIPLTPTIVALLVCLPGAAAAQVTTGELLITVRDAAGKAVDDLTPDEVLVRENGTPCETLTLRPAAANTDLVLLLDNSHSSADLIEPTRRALRTFLAMLPSGTRAAVITFGGQPSILQNLTTDRRLLADAVRRIVARPNTGTFLLDAIARVSRSAAERGDGHLAFVVVSTENVDYSSTSAGEALSSLQEAGATLHAYMFSGAGPPAVAPLGRGRGGEAALTRRRQRLGQLATVTDASRDRDELLTSAAEQTGGTRERLASPSSLETALRDLAASLRGRYVVRYARPDSVASTMKLQVEVKRPDVVVTIGPAR